jgi:dTDP-glucose 4,6-dehydratase
MSWRGKRVLVTGAGGFIGSHLAERLVREGAKVRALVHYNALGSRGWLDHSPLQKDMEIVAGDITDSGSVAGAMAGVEIAFHLAALIGIPYSYAAPRSYVRTNVEGTINVLEAARANGMARVVHTSTSETYGTALRVPIAEDHPLQGQSPYSATKIGADKLAEAYFRSFDLPVVTVRPFNTFGPRQSQRAIIPTIVTQLLDGRELALGNVHPTRDLNFVSNTVDGFLLAGTRDGVVGETINLGSGKEISVGDLARRIGELMGVEARVREEAARVRPPNSEVERLLADITRAGKLLGWKPKVSLDDGLRETIAWIKENRDRFRTGEYTV